MYLYNATSSYTEQVFCSLNGLLKNCLGGTCKSSCIVPLDERITKRSEHSNKYWGLERKNLLHLLSIFWIMILPPSTHAVLASHMRKQRTGHEESCKIAHETGIELCEKSISNFCSYCAIWEITIKLAPQANVVPMSHLSNCTYEKKSAIGHMRHRDYMFSKKGQRVHQVYGPRRHPRSIMPSHIVSIGPEMLI